ncbi:glycosyltransferase [Candidatus Poriferisodalis sp.]|uniref:glycosyltransferase n=1 Tax=Candidatus Poriferisodalis sp. TaxID=3101277 RepID=UPI003B02518D
MQESRNQDQSPAPTGLPAVRSSGLHAVAIVPAFDRADTVGATVTALRTVPEVSEVIVVDDGSRDRTSAVAAAAGARVVELARNRGKAAAVAAGIAASGAPEAYLLIDADVGDSAAGAGALLAPLATNQADMTVAVLEAPGRRSGFGLVKAFAGRVLRSHTGLDLAEPLSGQRAVRGPLLRSLQLAPRFGLELGLTLDAASRGAVIREVETGFSHLPTGRDLRGFAHRARIGRDVYRAAAARLGSHKALWLAVASLTGRTVGRALGRGRDRFMGRVRARRPAWRRRRQAAARSGAATLGSLRSRLGLRRRRNPDRS